MSFVGCAAEVGGLNEHTRIAAGFGFFDGEVVGLFELFEMGTEVAVGELEHLFERGEVNRVSGFKSTQGGHDPEANRLVNEGIEFFHGVFLT